MKYTKENIIKILERLKEQKISIRNSYKDCNDYYHALEYYMRALQLQETIDLLNNEDLLDSISRVIGLED